MNTVSNDSLLITLNSTPSKPFLAEKTGCRPSVEVQKENPQEGFSWPFTCNATGFRDTDIQYICTCDTEILVLEYVLFLCYVARM